jgi:hypothetical protein
VKAQDFINERRKKIRKAAYGPGMHGMYGSDAGYSGTESIDQEKIKQKVQHIKEFADFCLNMLDIAQRPKIKLVKDTGTAALGFIDADNGEIVVTFKNRHQMDIMRTLAHEIVHYKQMHYYDPDGSTGSYDENQANALAGVLMRKWGQENPHLFNEDSGV